MEKLKYNFEYGCYPLWFKKNEMDIFNNISPSEILLNKNLSIEIESIDEIYQSTYVSEDPRDSGFRDIVQASIVAFRVIHSAEILGKELEGKYEFVFDKNYREGIIKLMKQYYNM